MERTGNKKLRKLIRKMRQARARWRGSINTSDHQYEQAFQAYLEAKWDYEIERDSLQRVS